MQKLTLTSDVLANGTEQDKDKHFCIWEQQKGETDKHYELFRKYLDDAIGRLHGQGLKNVAAENGNHLVHIRSIAGKNQWKRRAAAYDRTQHPLMRQGESLKKHVALLVWVLTDKNYKRVAEEMKISVQAARNMSNREGWKNRYDEVAAFINANRAEAEAERATNQ